MRRKWTELNVCEKERDDDGDDEDDVGDEGMEIKCSWRSSEAMTVATFLQEVTLSGEQRRSLSMFNAVPCCYRMQERVRQHTEE